MSDEPLKGGVNEQSNEALLRVVADRLEAIQKTGSIDSCIEYERALSHTLQALLSLLKRDERLKGLTDE